MSRKEMSKEELCNCLHAMDFMLYNYAYEPSRCEPFKSCEEMAEYFRLMLHICLPKEYWYDEEELLQKSLD